MSDEVILYWGRWKPDEYRTADEWRAATAFLSPLGRFALQSHLKLGHRVLLHSHQNVPVPEGVDVVDAGEFVDPEFTFVALSKGCRIAYVSDLVRFRAGASRPQAVLMDLDQVMLNPLPKDQSFISSIPIRMTGILALKRRRDFKLRSLDGSWDGNALCDFPVRVGSAVKQAFALADNVDELLSRGKKGFKDCGAIMRDLRTLQEDSSCNAHPPLRFSPCPPWGGRNRCPSLKSPTKFDGRTELFGYALPSVDQILKESSAVSHWFESSINDSELKDGSFWDDVPDGCLLAAECRHVLGCEWRSVLPHSARRRKSSEGFGFGLSR